MDNSVNETFISLWNRISLLLITITLAIGLFFLRVAVKGNSLLDELARQSVSPEIALTNNRPTIVEFYADWCEACKSMAPSMSFIHKENKDEINLVLLNVDNPIYSDFIDQYDVQGIPQLNFFDKYGQEIGNTIGFKTKEELINISASLLNETMNSDLLGERSEIDSQFSKLYNKSSEDNTGRLFSPRGHA